MRIVQRLQRRLEQIFAQAEHAERQQRRKRRRATAGESFFVRQLEARQVLSADVVAGQQLTVAENSAAGTVVGTVQTTPQIDPAQPLTFSITAGNSSNAFLIAPNSGEIQVNNAVALDFETTPEWQLTIGVQADGETSPESTGVVTIRLTDVHAPAVVQLTGGDATLSLVDGHLHVQQGSTTLFDAPLADVSSLTVFGSNDADTLIVDSTNGNPIPDGGLLYDGGSQPQLRQIDRRQPELLDEENRLVQLAQNVVPLRRGSVGRVPQQGRQERADRGREREEGVPQDRELAAADGAAPEKNRRGVRVDLERRHDEVEHCGAAGEVT